MKSQSIYYLSSWFTKAATFMIFALLMGCSENLSSDLNNTSHSLTINEKVSQWFFVCEGRREKGKIKVNPGVILTTQLPDKTDCTAGHYEILIQSKALKEITPKQEENMGIYFPTLGYAKTIAFNGKVTQLGFHNHSSTGPIIVLNRKDFENDILKVTISFPKLFPIYSGNWMGMPIAGNLLQLTELRDHRTIHQTTIPILLSTIWFSISLILFSYLMISRSKDKMIYEYIFCLITWALYFLFISGSIRTFFPTPGITLHFSIRVLSTYTIIRILGRLASISKNWMHRVTLLTGVFAFAQAFNVYIAYYRMVIFLFFLLDLVCLVYAFILLRDTQSWIKKIVALSTLIYLVGAFCDLIKDYAIVFGLNNSFPYLIRYLIEPLLFTSIIYLVYQLSQEVRNRLKKEAFEEASAQFIHDVRAPIAALSSATSLIADTHEDASILIKTASKRIIDICHSLHSFNQNNQGPVKLPIQPLIEGLIREKLQQHSPALSKIHIESQYDTSSIGVSVEHQPADLSRILSNLINNSIESFGENSGKVTVLVGTTPSSIFIEIQDNGKGIPPQILKHLGRRGITYGKETGSGLGLYHAKKCMESWDGKLEITSHAGVGTSVKLVWRK